MISKGEPAVDDSWLEAVDKLKISDTSSDGFVKSVRQTLSSDEPDVDPPKASPSYTEIPWPRRASISMLPQLPPYDFAKTLFAAQHMYIGSIFSFLRPDDFETRLHWMYTELPEFDDIEDRLMYCQMLMVFAYGTMYSVNQWAGNDGIPGFHFFIQALDFLPELHEDGSVLFVEVLSLIAYYLQNLNRRDKAFLYVGRVDWLRMSANLRR